MGRENIVWDVAVVHSVFLLRRLARAVADKNVSWLVGRLLEVVCFVSLLNSCVHGLVLGQRLVWVRVNLESVASSTSQRKCVTWIASKTDVVGTLHVISVDSLKRRELLWNSYSEQSTYLVLVRHRIYKLLLA